MNYIILRNPKSIASETSIKKNNYYVVYNFIYNSRTVCEYNGIFISPEYALQKIRYDGVECRYYSDSASKTQSRFSEDNSDLYKASFAIALIGILGYSFCKN